MLVDAALYYTVLRRSLIEAEHSVVILGWDVDTRTVLEPYPRDGYPGVLLPLLNRMLADKPALRVYVLAWDFSLIYALERERMPPQKFAALAHERLAFALDGRHQVGAAHHQKIVVVDGQLAFVGGIDLTLRRWDTPSHAPEETGRTDPTGEPYAPMHDVQFMVSGPIARTLEGLAHGRWERATGERLPPAPESGAARWPVGLTADFENVELGIARTVPSDSELHRDIREVEQITLRAIAAARRLVFIENQYFTSTAVGDLLEGMLAQRVGSEVVLVLPRLESGWLEQSSMGVLRERTLDRLRSADVFGRFHVFYPHIAGLGEHCVNVHSKVLVVDDFLLKVGSANMSNRSLGLDTECDLVVEAEEGSAGMETRRAIRRVRARLLAEHLGLSADEEEQAGQREASLARFIAERKDRRRTLLPLPRGSDAPLDLSSLDQFVVDPEHPMAADAFIARIWPADLYAPWPRVLVGLLIVLLPLLTLGVLWHAPGFASLDWVEGVSGGLASLPSKPSTALYVALGFVGLGLCLCPITLLTTISVLAFGPVRGASYALLGALASACAAYGLGRALGHIPLGYLRGPRMAKLRALLRRRGFSATLSARLFPLGNFTLINLLAGGLYVPFPAFFLGNLFGLAPGIAGLAFCARELGRVIARPNLLHVTSFLGAVVLLGSALWLCGRMLPGALRLSPRRALKWGLS